MNDKPLKDKATATGKPATLCPASYPLGSRLSRAAARSLLDARRVQEAQGAAIQDTWDRIAQPIASWDSGPLLWLTKYTKSEDTHWLTKGATYKSHFPGRDERPDFLTIMEYLLTKPGVLITKSREMMATWLVCGYISWFCQFHPVFWIAQSGRQEKAAEMVDYARILYNNQEDWLKRKNPLTVDNYMELQWANGARMLAVPSGESQVRMYHPYGYFQDESAFLPEAQEAHDAVRPVCKQFIAVSTDNVPSWFHQQTRLEAS